jgi:geranylgeranyl pyrophosphate synthase
MCYSVLDGGKRIRPLLVYATGLLFGAAPSLLDAAAASVELIHCYSLIHDDLPAMDDDDLRRGKPTCHKKFGEALAILAGDALQAEAFKLLVNDEQLTNQQRIGMLQWLAQAAGASGMVGGQAIDLMAIGQTVSLAELEMMHRLKTGALIKVSVLLGAIAGGASVHEQKNLAQFADFLGLAFQIQDDILDVEGDTQIMGKQQGADMARDKPTYPSIVGMQQAKQLAADNYQQALLQLTHFGECADFLRDLTTYIVQRKY